jgi:hypothetical protein
MPLQLIHSLQQSGATIQGSHQETIPGTNIQGIVYNADTPTNNHTPTNTNTQNRPAVCGPICQKKKMRTYLIVGVAATIALGVTYFILKKK